MTASCFARIQSVESHIVIPLDPKAGWYGTPVYAGTSLAPLKAKWSLAWSGL
ncbi:hypothetical protein ACPOL_5192 [Acidisarcina polymorpha]|uniref:Uncharacterized protein n=1 Tax=Acidisarcina polymorpha TaxID=2211140 RepID=A0A2Z5G7B3_9BACT|nr:hypothetical protein ACPOL_5192 [Acidisarcina polymorpha]